MKTKRRVSAIIEKEENMYVALCPEFDIASQSEIIELTKQNLQESIELFLDNASPSEIKTRNSSINYKII